MVRNDGNVIAFPGSGPRQGDQHVPVVELAGAVDAIGRCLAEFSPEPRAGGLSATSVLLGMSAVERRLDKLADITVVTWPDAAWALRFCDARRRTLASIREAAASLQAELVPAGRLRSPKARDLLNAEVSAMNGALREIRDLIVERYPQTRSAC